MSRRFPALVKLFAIALSASALISCAGAAKRVSDNTAIKFEDIHVDDPARQGLTLVTEPLGAVVGLASSSRDDGLLLTLRLYLENRNGFTLELIGHVLGCIVKKGAKLVINGALTFDTALGEIAFPYSSDKTL